MTTSIIQPPRCACRFAPGRDLCPVMSRLRNRAAAEEQLALRTGIWSHHADVLEQAMAHLRAVTLAIR